jgi:hypothetical protein
MWIDSVGDRYSVHVDSMYVRSASLIDKLPINVNEKVWWQTLSKIFVCKYRQPF